MATTGLPYSVYQFNSTVWIHDTLTGLWEDKKMSLELFLGFKRHLFVH